MTAVVVVKRKGPGEIPDYANDWYLEAFDFWVAAKERALNARCRPTVATGFEYKAIVGGQTNGKKEPRWPTTLGGLITEGSVTWEAVALSVTGLLKQIQSSSWSAEDASITISNESIIATAGTQMTGAHVVGGADDHTWDVTNHVVFDDGTAFDVILRITIEDEAD